MIVVDNDDQFIRRSTDG